MRARSRAVVGKNAKRPVKRTRREGYFEPRSPRAFAAAALRTRVMAAHGSELVIGMDVGSTTVKAVVVDPDSMEILWHDYQRHHTRQPETVLAFLERILGEFPHVPGAAWRIFLTGSGAGPLSPPTGGKFVQEVNAVTL